MYISFESNLREVKGLLNNHKYEEAIELLYKINDYLLNDMRIEDSIKVSSIVSLVYTIKGHYNLFVETNNFDEFDISYSYYNKAIIIIDKLLNKEKNYLFLGGN